MSNEADAVYAAQILYCLQYVKDTWRKDAAKINAVSKDCQCFRRNYGLDGHVLVMLQEAVRLAEEQVDGSMSDERVRSWAELGRENRLLRSRLKSLRDQAAHFVETVDGLE